MPSYKAPGVYVEEVAAVPPIQGAAASETLFIGVSAQVPAGRALPLLTAFSDFERQYGPDGDLTVGGTTIPNHLAHAARGFFAEGGRRLRVIAIDRAKAASANWAKAFARARSVQGGTIVAAPGAVALPGVGPAVNAQLLALVGSHASDGKYAVLDPPPGLDLRGIQALRAGYDSADAALYWPWIRGAAGAFHPPSGFVAGIFARTDQALGIWKPPANQRLLSASAIERAITPFEQDVLNPLGINCIRSFPGRGILVWGARTLSTDPEWKYVNTRRFVCFVERSIAQGLAWAAFEPNDAAIWARCTKLVNDFLLVQWQAGALAGTKPEQAFFVHCDRRTIAQSDLDAGRAVIQIGLALLKPGEFVMSRIVFCAGAKT